MNNRLGSGSDYTVFLNFLGIPVIDMSFDGPYGVYHSIYDDHQWVSRIGDPGFRYHAAMTKLWGLMALRLANADVLPFDYPAYASRLKEFAGEIEKRWTDARVAANGTEAASPFAPVHAAIQRFTAAAAHIDARQTAALMHTDGAGRDALNRTLMLVERALLDGDGIPGPAVVSPPGIRAEVHLCARSPARPGGSDCGRRRGAPGPAMPQAGRRD